MNPLLKFTAIIAVGVGGIAGAFWLTRESKRWNSPQIIVDEQIDLGRLTSGSWIEMPLVIQNSGRVPLSLTGIRSSCGCLVLARQDDPDGTRQDLVVIGPGARFEFLVRATATGEVGRRFAHAIDFDTNDPHRAHIRVLVTGEVDGACQPVPPELALGTVPRGSTIQRSIEVRDYRLSADRIRGVLTDRPDLVKVRSRVEDRLADPKNPQLGKTIAMIDVEMDVPNHAGIHNASITINFEGSTPPVVVPISANVLPLAIVRPSVVVLPQLRHNKFEYDATVSIEPTAMAESFSVDVVEPPSELSITPRGNGRYQVAFRSADKPGAVRRMIVRFKVQSKNIAEVAELAIVLREPESSESK